MFSEVVKLIPQLDKGALSSFFSGLNKRFADCAKKFGQGMKSALKLSPFAAIGAAIVAKLLNPLQKAEEILDRVLHQGGDAKARADELGSDPGKLLRLEAVAQSRGVDQSTLHTLLTKFEGALSKERELVRAPQELQKKLDTLPEDDPQRKVLEAQLKQAQLAAATPGTLRNFIGEKDTADAFFKFIQNLQGVEESRRVAVQSEVFGERIRGRASRLFNATPEEFAALLSKLPSTEVLNKATENTATLEEYKNTLSARRELGQYVTLSDKVNVGQVNALDVLKGIENKGEVVTLDRFDQTKATTIAVQELTEKIEEIGNDLLKNAMPVLLEFAKEGIAFTKEFMPSWQEVKTFTVDSFNSLLKWAAEFETKLEGWIGVGMQAFEDVKSAVESVPNKLEELWNYFKSSKIYRTFGG